LWQLPQLPEMPVWLIDVPAKLMNALGEWQVSQAIVVGT
jgi:hypothetical protein